MDPGPRRRQYLRSISRAAAVLMILASSMVAAPSAVAAPPQVQALPSPLRFVSNLDLECFKTQPFTPPLPTTIVTRHLNPALAHLPAELTPLGPREQLCVPVAKNNVIPPDDVIEFIRFVDLSCYRTTGQAVNFPLVITHLNPQLGHIPPKNVRITVPVQLCVPVVKNGVFPPLEVRRLVSFIDLKCYVELPTTSLHVAFILSHLNRVLAHLPRHQADVTFNRQLCVPVQKNNQPIPADVINIIRWIDLEKYDIATPPLPAPVTLTLNHLNPLLANLPTETVTITAATHLLLPVAKNHLIPPV